MKKYYHATRFMNLSSIIEDGFLYTGIDGLVYLAETPNEALRFTALRYLDEDILVIEVELDESKVEETFDHSESFFKCKSYGYPEDIPTSQITNWTKYVCTIGDAGNE